MEILTRSNILKFFLMSNRFGPSASASASVSCRLYCFAYGKRNLEKNEFDCRLNKTYHTQKHFLCSSVSTEKYNSYKGIGFHRSSLPVSLTVPNTSRSNSNNKVRQFLLEPESSHCLWNVNTSTMVSSRARFRCRESRSRSMSTFSHITTCLQQNKNNRLQPKVFMCNQRLCKCYSKDTKGQKDDDINDVGDILTDFQEDKEFIKRDPELKAILEEIKSDFQDNSPPENVESDSSSSSSSSSSSESDDEQTTKAGSVNTSKPEKTAQEEDFIYDYRYADDIEDFDYAEDENIQEDEKPEKVVPISLTRGQDGVFDLDELLTFLDHLGVENVVTVPVPPEAKYCDYMIVSSAKSKRHLQYVNDEFLWIHKRKKNKSDPHLHIEGLKRSDWSAMDLGNLVLHVFYGDSREYYDIESLWTLGPENDPKCQELAHDPFALSEEDLFWMEASGMQEKEGKDGQNLNKGKRSSPGQSPGKEVFNSRQEDDAGWHDPKPPHA